MRFHFPVLSMNNAKYSGPTRRLRKNTRITKNLVLNVITGDCTYFVIQCVLYTSLWCTVCSPVSMMKNHKWKMCFSQTHFRKVPRSPNAGVWKNTRFNESARNPGQFEAVNPSFGKACSFTLHKKCGFVVRSAIVHFHASHELARYKSMDSRMFLDQPARHKLHILKEHPPSTAYDVEKSQRISPLKETGGMKKQSTHKRIAVRNRNSVLPELHAATPQG